jgi:hypothetical protein
MPAKLDWLQALFAGQPEVALTVHEIRKHLGHEVTPHGKQFRQLLLPVFGYTGRYKMNHLAWDAFWEQLGEVGKKLRADMEQAKSLNSYIRDQTMYVIGLQMCAEESIEKARAAEDTQAKFMAMAEKVILEESLKDLNKAAHMLNEPQKALKFLVKCGIRELPSGHALSMTPPLLLLK